MNEDYRYMIKGTLEFEQCLDEAYYCGWIAEPSMWTLLKRHICRHDFGLWCTNQGVPDCRQIRYRFCNKCGLEQEEADE